MPLVATSASPLRVLIPGAPPIVATEYPFLPGQQVTAWAAAAATVYQISPQARNNGKTFIHTLTANLGAAEIDIALGTAVPLAADSDVDANVDTALLPPAAPAKVLRAVVIRDRTGAPLRRRGLDVADGALSAESFKVKTSAANGNVIRLRGPAAGAFNAGETFTIFIVEAADIVTFSGAALNAARKAIDINRGVLYAGLAANEEVNLDAILPG